MSEEIFLEIRFFLTSIICGVFLLIIYDVIRIFRRLINHGGFFIAVEDLLFWIAGGVFIFSMAYQQNYGIIRSFSILGLILGMLVYHNLLSEYFVVYITKLIKWIFNLLYKLIHMITAPLRWFLRRLKWFLCFAGKKTMGPMKYLLKRLKKLLRTVKISITRK